MLTALVVQPLQRY